MSGRLVLVGTPIGNLGDLAPRAVEALSGADIVACEDTRRTGRLLQHADASGARLVVVNEHTERDASAQLVRAAEGGSVVALVTDAGMPAISDPGEAVVAAFVAAGLPVEVIPGPSALTTALAGSGLPTGRFVFEGFLPRKGSARSERLDAVAREERLVVLYEAPHRVARTLAELAEVCGPDRPVVIGRELTKLHEEWFRGELGSALDWLVDSPAGEFVILLDGAPPPEPATDEDLSDALRAELDAGSSTRDAVASVAAAHRVGKRRVYDLALRLT